MATPVRLTGQAVTVFTLDGGAYIDDLENATVDAELTTKEAKGIKELWQYPWGVAQKLTITADVFVGSAAAMMALWGTEVALSLVTGGATYAGNFLVTVAKHMTKRDDLQMQNITLQSRGTITVS